MNKFLTKIATFGLGMIMAIGVGVAAANSEFTRVNAAAGDQIKTISSDDVVSNSSYTKYQNSDAIITFGGNNKSVGTNSGNRSKCTLSSYSKYAVSPVGTSDIASAFVTLTRLENVGSVTYTVDGGSNQASTNVYAIYSEDGNTFSQLSLTSGTQGAKLSSGTVLSFPTCTGYFGLVFKATNSSGAWRLDSVVLTFKEGATAEPDTPSKELTGISVSGSMSKKIYDDGENWDPSGLVVYPIYDEELDTNETITEEVEWTFSPEVATIGFTSVVATARYNDFSASSEAQTVTVNAAPAIYTATSLSAVSSVNPISGSASYENTYNGNKTQITKDNTQTLEINSLSKIVTITQLTLYMKSNASAGAGNLSIYIDETEYVLVGSENAAFTKWGDNTSYGTEFRNVNFIFNEPLVAYNSIKTIISGITNSLYVQDYKFYFTEEEREPATHAEICWKENEGTYYNGENANSRMSSDDLIITLLNDNEENCGIIDSGIGFLVTTNDNIFDASSETVTIAFNGYTPGTHTLYISIGEIEGTIEVTIINKAPTSYEWTSAPITTFYSHVDNLDLESEFNGLKAYFTDNSTTTVNFVHVLRTFDENSTNNAGEITEIPTHTDGTINLSEETKFIVDSYHKDYEDYDHIYTVITIKVPTLHIQDNTVKYFVDETTTLSFNGTAICGDKTIDVTSQLVLYPESVSPSSTEEPIAITASWVKEDVVCGTAEHVISNIFNKGTGFDSLVLENIQIEAGQAFNYSKSITLYYIEDGDFKFKTIDQTSVTFITDDFTLIPNETTIYQRHSGEVVATYTEGELSISGTFELSVTLPSITEFTETDIPAGIRYTLINNVNDIESGASYFIAYNNYVFNGSLDTLDATENYVNIASAKMENTFTITKVGDSSYTIQSKSGKYIGKSAFSNGLDANTSADTTNTISFNGDNVVITGTGNYTLKFNNANDQQRFRYYKSGQQAIKLYKVTEGEATVERTNVHEFLTSFIDYVRLSGDTTVANEGLSICHVYNITIEGKSWATWENAKRLYLILVEEGNLGILSNQDKYGEDGKSYADTYQMLINKDPSEQLNSPLEYLLRSTINNSETLIITIICLSSIVSIGLYVYFKRKQENAR